VTVESADLAIVGAGAAGLTAAIFARRRAAELGMSLSIVALESARRPGAKILISGGGRCNVTHTAVSAADFNGGSRNTIARILRTFPVEDTVAFFAAIGVALKTEETGKLFPRTDRARTVLDALLREAGEVRTGQRVTAIRRSGAGFEVTTPMGSIAARSVILATGGRSVPKTGSDGFGYELARSLGHSVTRTIPALVPLLLDEPSLTALSGLSVQAELQVVDPHGALIRREEGSLLFTHFGLSGPLALDLSRHWLAAGGSGVRLNFFPGKPFETVDGFLSSRPRATVQSLLSERLPPRLAEALLERAEVKGETKGGDLRRKDRRRVAHLLTAMPVRVTGSRGFDYAEVTAGGVPLDEIDPRSMASRRTPALYLCGEILDVDGRIGGFNFQWAWATGKLAGANAAEYAAAAAG
jgi:predicted Rossmann fold flavoprotein